MNVYCSSPWIPAEWIEAHSLQPRGVWSAGEFGRGAMPLAAGVCAFAEAVLQFADAHPEAATIFTTSCDQMRRGFDTFSAAQGGRAFLFNIPATWQSDAARRMFQSELERLGRFLENLGGSAPTAGKLSRSIADRAQTRQRLLAAAPRSSARQFAEAVARFHWDGSFALSDASPPPASDSVPLALVGGPLTASEWRVLDLIEAAGARVVLNGTETGERSLLPIFRAEGASAEDPCDFLTRQYFENIVDVFQRPNSRLYSWLKERLAPRGARGIVLWVHTGCDFWRAEIETLREAFRLPVLLLEADETLAGSPREANRLEAFVETLR